MAATTGLWRRKTGQRNCVAATCVVALWSALGCASNEFGTGGFLTTIFGIGLSADQQCFRAGFTETETDALRRQVQLAFASDPEAEDVVMRVLASCSETYPTLDCTPCVGELAFEERFRLQQQHEQ